MKKKSKSRLLYGIKVPKHAEAVIMYEGSHVGVMPDHIFGNDKEMILDCPFEYVNPQRGPMQGQEAWKPMKKGNPYRR
ncbi:MAG: hypothetical protein KAJ47_04095, partial [Candidatus Aenigmarchaeota archaeon]|nr:hypothetical protein [Candidatus Aenigmarchaeota archaeon]